MHAPHVNVSAAVQQDTAYEAMKCMHAAAALFATVGSTATLQLLLTVLWEGRTH